MPKSAKDQPVTRIHLHHHFDSDLVTLQKLDAILASIQALRRQGDSMAATLQEVKDELTAIKAAVDTVKTTVQEQIAEIARLKALIEAGTPVTQEQLDALDAQADDILAALTPST